MSIRRHFLKLLSIAPAAAFVFLAACASPDTLQDSNASSMGGVNEVEESASRADSALQVLLTLDRSTYRAGESPTATVTFKNTSGSPLSLISWYLPSADLEEDLFRVALEGEPTEFLGPHFKRPAAGPLDRLRLEPGETLTRTADLERFYDFATTGTYSIRFEVDASRLRGNLELLGRQVVSAEVRVFVEGRFVPAPWEDEALGQGPEKNDASSLTFVKCSSTQSAQVTDAVSNANIYSDESVSYLSSNSSGSTRYTTWFGTYVQSRYTTVNEHFLALQDAFDTKAISVNCGCKKPAYAYVYPNDPYKIYVCNAFWKAPLTGTDSKAGTLIHEMSHFNVVAGTDDYVYGQTDAKALAKSDPNKAVNNADNHEYFAENNPKLP